ncbi:MAG TPA: methyl-accepting chemotaxis protein [Patescibacteria group bacterium]|nr:methyl-accepting chemotaxis protein [Patescibacteria group bacterium]
MNQANSSHLQCMQQIIPLLRGLFTADVSFALTDPHRYLYYQPGQTLDLKVEIGSALKPGTAVFRAIQEKRRTLVHGDKALFGLPYIALACPIVEADGQISGAVVVIESVARQEELKEFAGCLAHNIDSLAATTEEISAQTEEIAATIRTMAHTSQESRQRVQETDQVLALVKTIASQTNLLGLNAAIEAARVGEQGRGFGVVASEIRKLAADSGDSIQQIERIIHAVRTDSTQIVQQLEQIQNVVDQIAQALTDVASAVQETSTMSVKLDTMADNLTQEH